MLAQYQSHGADFSHVNVLGSETQNTDYAGNGGQTILYHPWGQVWKNPSNSYPNSFYQIYASLQLYDGSTYSVIKFNQALQYAASTPSQTFGTPFLVYPLKSSVFRSLLKASTRGLWVGLTAQADIAGAQALYTEIQAARAGECQ